MTVHVNRDLIRAQRAARRGLEALGRRVPAWTETRWDTEAPDHAPDGYRGQRERTQRAHLEALDAGRDLIAAGLELERQAELAKRAGVETLRHAWPASSWDEIGALLGVSRQAAHKRYRDVEGPEAELTIDDELALTNGHAGGARHELTGPPARAIAAITDRSEFTPIKPRAAR